MNEETEIKEAKEHIEKELYSDVKFLANGGQAFIFLKDFEDYKIIIKYFKNDYNIKRDEILLKLNYYNNKINLTELNHNNIMKVLKINHDLAIIESEYCGSDNLSSRILKNSIEDNLISFWQIMNAVKFISENDLSLTDLKPQNICLFKGENKPKIIDINTIVNLNIQPNTYAYYTATYSDPLGFEGFNHHTNKLTFDKKSDIFSLGCILYYIIQKKELFPDYLENSFYLLGAIKNNIDSIKIMIYDGIPYTNVKDLKNEHFKELITDSIDMNGNRPYIDEFIDKFEQIIPKKVRKTINSLNIN